MADIEVYFSGDTVRFKVEFRDYPEDPEEEGELLDPSDVDFIVYNADAEIIDTGSGDAVSTGVFSTEYTVPTEPGTYYIEWKGMVNAKPELRRKKFKVKFWVDEDE